MLQVVHFSYNAPGVERVRRHASTSPGGTIVEQRGWNGWTTSTFDRRRFLGGALAVGAGALAAGCGSSSTIARAQTTVPAGSDLGAVEHVVFLMQENRSFDHYFGTYKGVRGFDDHPSGQPRVPSPSRSPATAPASRSGRLLPFHLDTATGLGECTYDLSHNWLPQHLCRNHGRMDAFVATHTSAQYEGPAYGVQTMGYHTRADLPYHYALADAFTICDGYHCSIMGPTHPNRLMALSGTIDPDGLHGGPVLITNETPDARFSVNWTTVPELLEDKGVSWKTYSPPGPLYQVETTRTCSWPPTPSSRTSRSTRTRRRRCTRRPSSRCSPTTSPTTCDPAPCPACRGSSRPLGYDEHPPAPPSLGAWYIDQVLQTLIANPEVWSKTVLFVMYDENDGFFDHVAPPVAPVGHGGGVRHRQPPAGHGPGCGRAPRAGLPGPHAGGLTVQPRRLRVVGDLRPHLPDPLPRGAVRHPGLGDLGLAPRRPWAT